MFTNLYKLFIVLLLLQNTFQNANTSDAQTSPNVIIIMADDMGFDDVSFRGGNEFLTPNIDALAYHGRILDRLYAPAMCTPSRSALLTGRYPIYTGTQHFVISNEAPWALPQNITTMAQIFQSAGYATNLVGKWHLGFARKEHTPTYRGFDYHYGYWGSYIDYYARRAKMPVGNFSLGYDFRRNMELECTQAGVYVTDLLTQEAERLIMMEKFKPLLLIISHLAAHTGNEDQPLQAPNQEINKFNYIKDPRRRKYAAMISKLDASVGRIINALARTSKLENSIVLFYSDNGAPTVGQFANTGKNWPFKGQKNTPWEGGVRVAGAIWSPLLKARGTIFSQPIYVGDWLPTLAHAANIELNGELLKSIDGIDLWPQLVESKSVIVERSILHHLDDIWHITAYMQGQYKYINGTTQNGINDHVLTYREIYETDSRAERYAVEIRNSLASRSLSPYDQQRLTKHRIETLRAAAAVSCGQQQRACNALIEECLYDLSSDPCERNNLAAETAYENILIDMRLKVQEFRRTAWPVGNQAGRWEFDPSLHDCAWTNFLEEPSANVAQNCDYQGAPCQVE